MVLKKILLLLASIIIFFVALFFYLANYQFENKSSFTDLNRYEFKIDIPQTQYKLLEKEMQKFVEEQEKLFFSEIDITLNINTTFNISYNISSHENIQIVTLYSKIKVGNIDQYQIKTIHYDIKNNQIISLRDYLLNEQSAEILSHISYFKVLQKINQEELKVDEKTKLEMNFNNFNTFDYYQFIDDGLELSFVLNQNIEITILLPYSEINYLLKNEYRKTEITPYKRDVSQFAGKKLIAFTFDDGPNTMTTELLLNGLNKYNAKVTFFVLGNRVNANSDVLKRAYMEGNQIGSHTYNHKNLIKLNSNQIDREVNNTVSVINNIIGSNPSVFRPPYGNSNYLVKQHVNVPIIMWNIDSLDWKYRDKEVVKNNIVSSASDGDIVLVHDIYLSSVEGALLAMEELYNQGFAFVTIDEMMQLKGIDWQQGKYYYKF